VLEGSILEHTAYRQAQNRGHAITETKIGKLNQRADALMEALLEKVTKAIEVHGSGLSGKRGKVS
jgi:chromosome partitioning protein